jgi:hypothetical protein
MVETNAVVSFTEFSTLVSELKLIEAEPAPDIEFIPFIELIPVNELNPDVTETLFITKPEPVVELKPVSAPKLVTVLIPVNEFKLEVIEPAFVTELKFLTEFTPV